MFFLSGALFPVQGTGVPNWLQTISNFNPLTYCVDSMRSIVWGGAWRPLYPLYYDLLVICGFDLAMIIIGTLAFNRTK
jgi:ABC-2 type transport system permease protein